MMKFKLSLIFASLFCGSLVYANDSTGYVATGGIHYLKNKQISMHSEDLFISKDKIRVNYQFKNLSNQTINETILFPLPKIDADMDNNFADTDALIKSFKVWVNGKLIQPSIHVRTFMYPIKKGERQYGDNYQATIDTTELFKRCGVTETEMMYPWSGSGETNTNKKLLNCQDDEIKALLIQDDTEDYIPWQSQIVYSWQQSFKANAMTQVKHEYRPLVGGSVATTDEELKQHCADSQFKQALSPYRYQDSQVYSRPVSALSYILTTGGNWAMPIQDFTLTIQRDKNEIVSFCWDGDVKKINETTFQMKKQNFKPQRELDILFVQLKP